MFKKIKEKRKLKKLSPMKIGRCKVCGKKIELKKEYSAVCTSHRCQADYDCDY